MTPPRDQQSAKLAQDLAEKIRRKFDERGTPRFYTYEQLFDLIHAALTAHDEARKHLGNLLAIIHGDGGHYQAEHGNEKATTDAIAKYYELRAKHDEALPGVGRYTIARRVGSDEDEMIPCRDGQWVPYSALRPLVDALRQHQEWMEEDGMRSDGVPIHDCDFALAPESGTCSFHELYAATVEALQPYSGQKP